MKDENNQPPALMVSGGIWTLSLIGWLMVLGIWKLIELAGAALYALSAPAGG
jgi:hypothetical protein